MAFAVTDVEFDPRTIPESYILLRDVKRIPYGENYTQPAKTAEVFSPSCPAVMVDNDCVIVTGESLLQAFDRLEVMESTAHSIINSMAVGNIVHISQEEVADLKVAFNLKD
jgi:L-fuculose-phosphate aldolase